MLTNYWQEQQARLERLYKEGDIHKFLNWKPIIDTMYVKNAKYIAKEMVELLMSDDYPDRWKKALIESSVGKPEYYTAYPFTSENLIHQVYHIKQFEDNTGRKVNEMETIVEFGAGYGCMCRAIHSLGFSGSYFICDIPIMQKIQTYYLNGHNIFPEFNIDPEVIIVTCKSPNLFISNWALSEVPIELRNQMLPIIDNADFVQMAFQDKFEDIDNLQVFNDMFRKIGATYSLDTINHLPGNNFYLFKK